MRKLDELEPSFKCPGCGSQGFEKSPILGQCTFCDGQAGGGLPTLPCRGCSEEVDVTQFGAGPWEVEPETFYCNGGEGCHP